jgi:nucleotide-binding universal stress UspA family protein
MNRQLWRRRPGSVRGTIAGADQLAAMYLAPITSVFHPTDFSRSNEGAFIHALRIALLARCDLSLLHVGRHGEEHGWEGFPSVRDPLIRWGVLPAGAPHSAVTDLGVRVTKWQKVNSDPVEAIGEYVAEHLPDLVVLSTHQRQGLSRLRRPAVAEQIARLARVRTLFVPRRVAGFVDPDSGGLKLRRILIPVDHDPRPAAAVGAAASLARALGQAPLEFVFLHVGLEKDYPSAYPPEHPGWTREVVCEEGDVVDTILNVSDEREVDLIVMATRGHDGFVDALRGSTTERVLRGAKCPLLAVPAQ